MVALDGKRGQLVNPWPQRKQWGSLMSPEFPMYTFLTIRAIVIMKRDLLVTLFLVSVVVITTGCQRQASEGTTTPAINTLIAYLNALVDKDEATLSVLSCAAWEADALLELDAFQSVETRLEGLSCQQNVADDGAVIVTCQGKIIASYSAEVQEFDLSQRTYNMVEQNGDWLVCGY